MINQVIGQVFNELTIIFNCHKSTVGDIIRLKTWV
jgi:hypothetical protein